MRYVWQKMVCNWFVLRNTVYLHGTTTDLQVVSVQHVGQKLQQLKSLWLPLAQICCACVQHPSVGPAKHSQASGMCMLRLIPWNNSIGLDASLYNKLIKYIYSSRNTPSKLLCLPAQLIVPAGRTSLSSARMLSALLCYLSAAIWCIMCDCCIYIKDSKCGQQSLRQIYIYLRDYRHLTKETPDCLHTLKPLQSSPQRMVVARTRLLLPWVRL